jgi:hypothetical protein
MMIGEKFQNQGGDRSTREMTHFVECLFLPKLWNTVILFFIIQKYMIRLSFWWGIRICKIQKASINERGWNLKFSHENANFMCFWSSRYFEDFSIKTWSKSNKNVMFGISAARSITIYSFQRNSKVALDFWCARTLIVESWIQLFNYSTIQ